MTDTSRKRIMKWVWIVAMCPLVLIFLCIALVWAFADIPSFEELEDPDTKLATQIIAEDGEILTFLESVYRLADAHVERYLQRGFTHLMFSFGCTGGQHRSVYSAQHLAEHLHHKFGIEVHITHREQHITQTLCKP